MNLKKHITIILFFISILNCNSLFAQVYPVNASVILTPPHPITYSKYTDIGSNSIQANLSFVDLNEPSWDVYISLTIESQDLKISTSPNFKPSLPITLYSGVPKILRGSDFYEYFDFNNVVFQNIDAATINSTGNFPEGFYTFCITVLDYKSGIPISSTSCNSAYLSLETPPIIISPSCESAIEPSSSSNIFFNWQMSGGSSPTTTFNSTYKIFLYQITDDDTDYQSAVQNNKAILVLETDYLTVPNFILNSTNPAFANLQTGERYVFRIRALDAQQNNIYNNNGYTEWCWFYYGYPDDGVININFPEDNHIFGKMDLPYLSFDASDKASSGQQFNYEIKIYEVNENQTPKEAAEINNFWLSETLPPSQNPGGEIFNITKTFKTGTKYSWFVQSSTSGQLVASSDTLSFNSPPLISSFKAGNTVVKVVSLENNNLDSLRGIGRIQLSNDPQDYIETSFSNIEIISGVSDFVLNSGQIIFDLAQRDSLSLSPNLFKNGDGYFIYDKGRVNRDGFNVFGKIHWPLPHPVSNNSKNIVSTNKSWFGVKSNFTIFGQAKLDSSNIFDLIDPMNFRLDLSSNSKVIVNDNNYDLMFLGDVYINSDVKTSDDSQYRFYFGYPTPESQLNYIKVTGIQNSSNSPKNFITPVDNLNMGIFFKEAIIDFSETKSPDKLSGDLFWKGVYINKFFVRMYESSFDGSNQISIPKTFDFDEDLSAGHELWVNSQGLHFKYENSILNYDETSFNEFKSDLYTSINIVDNHVESNKSFIKGAINIPLVSKTEEFSFQIPIADNGLQDGFLDEDLTQRVLNFNPYGGENAVNISLKRAIFSDNDHLKFEIDFEVPALSSTVTGVDDFRVYGNGLIGFGGINKSRALTNQVSGTYKQYSTFIEEVGAAFINGDYAFSYKATIDMGSDVNGASGPPVMAISSVESAGDIDYVKPIGSSLPEPDIEVPDSSAGSQELTMADMKISINNAIVEIDGYLNFKQNDPKWGTCFKGGINGQLKIPSKVDLGANIIAGQINDMDYWYFDAYFNDTEGMGLSVFGAFNLTALEGRIYRHMSYDTIDKEYTVDPSVNFGAGLYMQIIDPSGGRMLAADIAAEVEVTGKDFVVNVQGDLKMINDDGRSPGGKSGAIKAAGKVIVEEAIAAIGPISLDIPIAGGNMKVTAEGTKSGSLNYTKNSLEFGLSADVSSTPSVNFLYKNNSNDFNFGASAEGDFDLGLSLSDGKSISMGMAGTKSGFFKMNFDDISFNSSIDRTNKTGSLGFSFGDKALSFDVLSDGGRFDLQIDQSNNFNAGFSTSGSAYLGFKIDNNIFNISGDKSAGTGLLDLDINGIGMTTSFNTSEKSAAFNLNTSGIKLDVAGKYNVGGSFLLESGNTKFDVAADLPSKTGHVKFETGDTRLEAILDADKTGSLMVKHGAVELGVSGNSTGTAGSVHYKDNNSEFTVASDMDNSTGSVVLSYANTSISSSISPDSTGVHIGVNSFELDMSTNMSSTGNLSFKNGYQFIELSADLDNNIGSIIVNQSVDSLNPTTISMVDGTIQYDFSGNVVIVKKSGNIYSLQYSDYIATISSSIFKVDIQGDKQISVDKISQELAFKYDAIQVSFSKSEALSFSDGQRSFSLASTGFSLSDGDKSLSVLNDNGETSLKLINGNDSYFVNQSGFSIDYDNRKYAINKQEYLHIDFDASTYIKVDNNSAVFNKDGKEFTIGGSTNFLELKDSKRSIALDQNQTLVYNEGSYSASLSKELKVELSDGTRTLNLFDDNHVLKYSQGNYEFGIRGGSGNKPGIDLTVDGNTIFVEGSKSKDVTVGLVSQEFGSVSVTCDKNKNIEGAFSYNGEDFSLKAGKQGLSFVDPNDDSQNAQAEILDGATPAPEMNGPQYIGDKITDGVGGRVSGLVQVYYNSAKKHFIGNAAVSSTAPPCVEAGLAIEVTPDYWKFDLGTETNMIQIYPTCSGFGGGGWLGLTPSEFNVGVFVGWRAGGSVKIGGSVLGCRVWGEASAELGVRASGEYKPKFKIQRAGVWVSIYVGIGVDYWYFGGSGNLTIAEASLAGTLDLYFEDKTRVVGSLEGKINVLSIIKADFKMKFETTV